MLICYDLENMTIIQEEKQNLTIIPKEKQKLPIVQRKKQNFKILKKLVCKTDGIASSSLGWNTPI